MYCKNHLLQFLLGTFSFVDMKYVVFTGHLPSDETAQIEVIDESGGATKICRNEDSRYPLHVYGATGVYTEGKMIVCGGSDHGPPSAQYDI